VNQLLPDVLVHLVIGPGVDEALTELRALVAS
jgi:hypothetical protein